MKLANLYPMLAAVLLISIGSLYLSSHYAATPASLERRQLGKTALFSRQQATELAQLRADLKRYRKQLSALHCRNEDDDPNGGWCLHLQTNRAKGGSTYRGYPRAAHYKGADEELGKALAELFRNGSVLDLGAGFGQYGIFFAATEPTIDWVGFDGAMNVEAFTDLRVNYADLTQPLELFRNFDWVMCLEVGEHTPKEFESTVMDNIAKYAKKGIVMSWGRPGQTGHGHVNLQPRADVIHKMESRGFTFSEETAKALMDAASFNWLKDNILVFLKN